MSHQIKVPTYYSKVDQVMFRKLVAWMQRHVQDNLQEHSPWEVNTTALAEDCAWNSNIYTEVEAQRALDDETHVIWDAAAEVGEWYENLDQDYDEWCRCNA